MPRQLYFRANDARRALSAPVTYRQPRCRYTRFFNEYAELPRQSAPATVQREALAAIYTPRFLRYWLFCACSRHAHSCVE